MDEKRYTLMVVEDDTGEVLLIQRAFEKARVVSPIQIVGDGDEAVAYLSGQGKYADRQIYPLPSLMILDLKLPRRSGFEVLQWLRAQPGLKRMPVVVLTASALISDINRAYDLGVNSYLVKPVRLEELKSMVELVYLYWLGFNYKPEVVQSV
jgi:CheY-like chemotaxis protein